MSAGHAAHVALGVFYAPATFAAAAAVRPGACRASDGGTSGGRVAGGVGREPSAESADSVAVPASSAASSAPSAATLSAESVRRRSIGSDVKVRRRTLATEVICRWE